MDVHINYRRLTRGMTIFVEGFVSDDGRRLTTYSVVPEVHRLALAEANLGLLRLRQKRLIEAEQLLTHALALQNRMPTPVKYNLEATVRALAQLRMVQHRERESAELMARAATIHSGQ